MLLLEVTNATQQKVSKLLFKIICQEMCFSLSYIRKKRQKLERKRDNLQDLYGTPELTTTKHN